MIDNQSLRLIGALKYDPGYLLLMDLMQAKLDQLTDELANPGLSVEGAAAKLRYWQAYREITHTLRVQPEAFTNISAEEAPIDETEPILTREVWAKLHNDAWRNIQPPPEEIL